MRRMQRQSIRKKGPLREGKSIRVASVTSSPVQNTDNNAMMDFERANMMSSSLRQLTMVYPLNGGGYSNNGLNLDFSRPLSMSSSQCSRLRSSNPGICSPPSTSINMMNAPYGSPASHMQQPNNFMMAGNLYANNSMRGSMYSGMSILGSAQPYRPADASIANLSHKRVLDVQTSQRELWKNNSPVSVTAPIFRGTPLQQN
ncbi:uncharacterized protein PHALS_08125 [Plasmopara halstedii]|uniref:Uncharacterized protein n=1 Tax=Plasmopara halstedii TaxID=4781 RepID=A0A0P1B6E9_PLAHL|nr:uncharacterized protein PHALS_08125 [Plasmopara halstedii]CEG50413.1 hypothetical protein PHALS_08125 [Plasmopara halstedii]|eukprot:XP_024586782.1 hypothetical protein PHALS_08125 [Plasmopara halstedii]